MKLWIFENKSLQKVDHFNTKLDPVIKILNVR